MQQIGADPLHFGVIMILALAVGGVTPPLAVNLFVTSRIINIRIDETFPDVLYVILVMIVALAVILLFPQLTLWIPSLTD